MDEDGSERVNRTQAAQMLTSLMDVIDEGPWEYSPKMAMALAISTPLGILALCCVVMVCRGVPCTPCGGLCTWCKPKRKIREISLAELPGLKPDMAIEEHQDENCDTDSADEPERLPDEVPALEEEAAAGSTSDGEDRRHRECCSKMAAALESGTLNGHGQSTPLTAPSSAA